MCPAPTHAVTAWVGNAPAGATKRDLPVIGSEFEKAARGGAGSGAAVVQNPVQSGNAPDRHPPTVGPQPLAGVGDGRPVTVPVGYCRPVQMGRVGVEPTSNPL